jgi:5'-nucleotidase
VLVTNDDGLHAPGLVALARAVVSAGHEVTVAAPLEDRSGASASLVLDVGSGVAVRRTPLDALPGVDVVGVDGSPALAVLLAAMGAFGDRPRVVAAGINAGTNTGRSILHSGTVGAALSASTMGMSGLAVSLAGSAPQHWDTAGRVAVAALDWLVTARRRTVLNVNVPDVPAPELRGARWGRLAAFGTTRLVVNDAGGERIQVEQVAGGLPLDPDTDAGLVAAGYVAVTPLGGLTAVDDDAAAVSVEEALTRDAAPAAGADGEVGHGG